MNAIFWLTLVLFVGLSILLVLLILIQKGRGGGLAGAFGGAGGSTAFGSKTGDVLTWATSVVFGVFLLLGIVLNWTTNARDAASKAAMVSSSSTQAPASPSTSPPAGMGVPAAPPAKH